ncbi:class I adenylate-forming enzyme family protein [Actinoplanes awajinensis]|uniref:class I adenylate-forming enzyme family protein n=1 Tax=Actinoplanes awajinensis TaxID=135946 RepID=UPI000A02316F|nr:class I adenylate-forming enzyme family protein [Actinoplanes awajinensis]
MSETTIAADGFLRGPPLERTVAHEIDARVDALLTRAALLAPDRIAVRSGAASLTFAELDRLATRSAAALRTLTGGPDQVVALAGVLDPVFAAGFFGIARAGGVSALINPLLREDGLVHALNTVRAGAVVATPEMHRRIQPVRHRLPGLLHLVLTHREDGVPADPDVPTLSELIAAAPPGVPAPAGTPDAVACLQLTSGTSGPAKAVQLTHRNLTVNAAQTVYGHRLTADSVLFNYLPTFHLMHLTIGLVATATHVLCAEPDLAVAMRAAAACGATHLYSLPVRLSRLAVDPRLPAMRIDSLRAILSGGSAMPESATVTLSEHFGIPVVQGYGLAETSPSTHLGDLDRPRTGSCGLLVPGTDCRIVDVDTGTVLPIGAKGEVQVRGPQLMHGYLGRERSQDVDPDGWFATGDIGRIDPDGYLFLVDRLKDVFKRDNWLVAPATVERELRRHPAVTDCVVFDYPDEFSGAVAYGLAVVRDGAAGPADLMAYVNDRLPYYEHLAGVELVDEIPRSATGKVRRRELRDQTLDRHRVTTARADQDSFPAGRS